MKTLKLLLFAAALPLLVPSTSSAGLLDILDPILNPTNGSPAPVPEPSGALIMGAALLTVAFFRRRK